MAVIIGNARKDENGNLHSGAAGDQTGKEVTTQAWYSYPWNMIIRPKSSAVAEKIAYTMEVLCNGNLVGYDQYQRTTLYTAMETVGFDATKLNVKCETDCSAMVAVCIRAAGIGISKDVYTGNLKSACVATGQFEVLTASKYLTSSNYLKRGDILLNTVHHTAIVLNNGAYAGNTVATLSSNSGSTTFFSSAKTYKNKSTSTPVFSETTLTTKTGSLNGYETCECLAIINGRYLVKYKVDGSNAYKTGFVAYSGGVS